MKNTVIGFLGINLDASDGEGRWNNWRPTVDLCRHEDFLIDQYELLYEKEFQGLADRVIADIRQISPETKVTGRCLGIQKPWDLEDVYGNLLDYIQELKPDREQSNYYAHITTGTHIAQICLFILTESRHLPGKLIQTAPARGRDVGSKPGSKTVIDLDLSKYDNLNTRFEKQRGQAQDILKSGIATKNKNFNKLIGQIETVALRSTAPMLITGPTGAGKSQLAGKVYQLRQERCDLEGTFVEVNCATLRGDIAMSTLFGHKKGAFTGAQSDRPGLLREANQGILFLDEIGELGLDEQAMLLRALEEGKWLPVGSDKVTKSSFQLIAGTNRNLINRVVEGKFREDLLARINTWTFQLPGLKDRTEDIEPNLEYELALHTQQSGRSINFNKEAYQKFAAFAKSPDSSWLGNFRDLNAAVTRMSTLAPRGRITTDEVDEEIERLQKNWNRSEQNHLNTPQLEEFLNDDLIADIDPFDRPQLAYTISVCTTSKSISDAGRKLFSVSRKKRKTTNDGDRLRKYLHKFNLSFEDL